AMHREPERRYVTAAAFAQDVENYLEGRPVAARPDSFGYRAGKFLRRNLVPVTSAAGVVILIASLVAFYTARLAAERDVAEHERATAASVSDFMVDVFRLANPNEVPGAAVTVREALDAAAKRIDRDLANQPQLRLTLMRKMGQSYGALGLWAEGRNILERTVAQERQFSGNHTYELAETLTALGHNYHNAGQFEDAGRVFNEAASILHGLGRDQESLGNGGLDYGGRKLRTELRLDG